MNTKCRLLFNLETYITWKHVFSVFNANFDIFSFSPSFFHSFYLHFVVVVVFIVCIITIKLIMNDSFFSIITQCDVVPMPDFFL